MASGLPWTSGLPSSPPPCPLLAPRPPGPVACPLRRSRLWQLLRMCVSTGFPESTACYIFVLVTSLSFLC